MLLVAARLEVGAMAAAAEITAVLWKKERRFMRVVKRLNVEQEVVLLPLVNVCFFAEAICDDCFAHILLCHADDI